MHYVDLRTQAGNRRTGLPAFVCAVMMLAFLLLAPALDAAAQDERPVDAEQLLSSEDAFDAFASEVREKTAWFGGFPTRVVGTPAHEQAMDELLERVQGIPGTRVWVDPFDLASPRTEEAYLDVSGGALAGRHDVYPFWPAGTRLSTTPLDGLDANLFYIGDADLYGMPGRSLDGQVAVMELAAGINWQNAAAFGARAIILLGSGEETFLDAIDHDVRVPLSMPRFFVPDGDLAEALRSGAVSQGRLVSRASWQPATARNIYALVQPSGSEASGKRALVVAVQADSMGITADLAPGADAALDTAVALQMLEHIAAREQVAPFLEHPVVFAFLDAYSFDQKGMRQMLGTLGSRWEDREEYADHDFTVLASHVETLSMANDLRAQDNTLRKVYRSEYRARLEDWVKNEASLILIDLDDRLQPLRLEAADAEGEEAIRLQRQVDALNELRADLNRARKQMMAGPGQPLSHHLASMVGMELETPEDQLAQIDDDVLPIAQLLWDRAVTRLEHATVEVLERVQAREARKTMQSELRAALGIEDEATIPISFIFGLNLSDAGVYAGPDIEDTYYAFWDTENTVPFMEWLERAYRTGEDVLWPPDIRPAVTMRPRLEADGQNSYTVDWTPMFTGAATSFSLPSVSWTTLSAFQSKILTARDTVENLDWSRVDPQVKATARMLELLVADPSFNPKTQREGKWSRVSGQVVVQGLGDPLPTVPKEGFLVALMPGNVSSAGAYSANAAQVMGTVRRVDYTFSGADGRYYFYDLPGTGRIHTHFVQAAAFLPDGSIREALDYATQGTGAYYTTSPAQRFGRGLRSVAFKCREMNAFHLYDPRFLQEMLGISFLDALRGAAPQRVSYALESGMVSGLTEPDVRWQIIMRNGVTANRMLLLNVNPEELTAGANMRDATTGFPLAPTTPQHPVRIAAHDMYHIDRVRLANYRRAGITSAAIDEIQATTERLLEEGEAAVESDDAGAMFYAYSGALANEVRGYQAVRDLGNDVVRAAVFLLLALIPFSFAMERLLFASPHVYRQIVTTLIIFVVMTAILWSFHPAFRITSQPLVIIMSFAIIFMSVLVMTIVLLKFKTQIEEMKSERAEASGAKTSQLGLISTAVKLGIANMRKRALRTALTGITVVLITFALMAFTSTSSFVGQREFELTTGEDVPYAGILLRQPGSRELTPQTMVYLRNILRFMEQDTDGFDASAERFMTSRYWWQEPGQPHWKLHATNPVTGDTVAMVAALGLSQNEDKFTGIAEVCPNWERFAELEREFPRTEEGGCYLATDVADLLGVDVGDTVVVAGYDLELVGTYDPDALSSEVLMMDGQSLLPLDFHAMGTAQRQEVESMDLTVLSQEMETGEGMEVNQDLPHVSPSQMVIVPAEMLNDGFRDSALRSIAVRTENVDQARIVASKLVERFAFPVYYGAPEHGVRVLAATPLLPQPPRSLVILIVLAGLIIFNTMMSSIAERKREIYIYTSLGLAPFHIGVLFLTEAVTYGLMGSIFGYIIGQGVATGLSELGWLGAMTLNYSGTQTIATMIMVLFVVVISSLIPAYLAGRLAVPSNEMTWRVPNPKDGVIEDSLPFTVTPQTANGTMMFLRDYFDAHSEGSIGHFTTDFLEVYKSDANTEDGRTLLALRGTVWLSPYDLSVRQDFEIHASPTDEADVLGITIRLIHGSGHPDNWVKLNKTFMGDLRRQLLGWRSLKVERILRYIADARQVAGTATA